MRENILDKEQSKDLQIYAVWLNQRSTDGRDEIDESILDDPRVTQYWDQEGITGTYFAETDLGGLGSVEVGADVVLGAEVDAHLPVGPLRRGVDHVVAVERVEPRRVRVGGPEADRGRACFQLLLVL